MLNNVKNTHNCCANCGNLVTTKETRTVGLKATMRSNRPITEEVYISRCKIHSDVTNLSKDLSITVCPSYHGDAP